MIRSFLKKGLGKILGGGDGAPTSPKAYPFNYDAAKGKAAMKVFRTAWSRIGTQQWDPTAWKPVHKDIRDGVTAMNIAKQGRK